MSDPMKLVSIPKVGRKEAYEQGYDCGLNGADTTNCHFSIFSSKENSKAWVRGHKAALIAKENE